MAKQYYLSEADKRVLELFHTLVIGDRKPGAPAQKQLILQAPEVYIAKIPDDGIPARVGTKPGVAECIIQTLSWETPGDEDSDYILEDVVLDSESDPVLKLVQNVFNLYYIPVYAWAEEYLIVHRDKFGRWLCEKPTNSFYGIMNEGLGPQSTAEFEFVKNPVDWQRTGITGTIRDYFLNLGDSVDEGAKIELKREQNEWVWRVAYCEETDTPPLDAEEE